MSGGLCIHAPSTLRRAALVLALLALPLPASGATLVTTLDACPAGACPDPRAPSFAADVAPPAALDLGAACASVGCARWSEQFDSPGWRGLRAERVATAGGIVVSAGYREEFVPGAPSSREDVLVVAYDAVTGAEIWSAQPAVLQGATLVDLVVGGGRVYVLSTGFVGSTFRFPLLAFDLASGALLWQNAHTPGVAVGAFGLVLAPDGAHVVYAYRTPTLVIMKASVVDGTLSELTRVTSQFTTFHFFGDGALLVQGDNAVRKLTSSGALVWQWNTPELIRLAATPHGADRLFVSFFFGRTVALRSSDGALLWDVTGGRSLAMTLTTDGATLVLAPEWFDLRARGLSLATGALLWQVPVAEAPSALGPDRLFTTRGDVTAINTAAGSVLWTRAPADAAAVDVRASAAGSDGRFYLAGVRSIPGGPPVGFHTQAFAAEGSHSWNRTRIEPGSASDVVGALRVAGDRAFALIEVFDGDAMSARLVAMDAATGARVWSAQAGAPVPVLRGMALAVGESGSRVHVAYVGGDGVTWASRAFSFDAGSGAKLWEVEAPTNGARASLAEAAGWAGPVLAVSDGAPATLVQLDRASGATVWSTTLAGASSRAFVEAAGAHVLVASGATLHALVASTGAPAWSTSASGSASAAARALVVGATRAHWLTNDGAFANVSTARLSDGALLWATSLPAYGDGLALDASGATLYTAERRATASWDRAAVGAFQATDGALRWRTEGAEDVYTVAPLPIAVSGGRVGLVTTQATGLAHLTILATATGTRSARIGLGDHVPPIAIAGVASTDLLLAQGVFGARSDVLVWRAAATVAPSAPAAPVVSRGPGLGELSLTWTPSATGDAADAFDVSRATPTGAYSLVASLPGSVTTWTDAGLPPNATYRYTVVARNAAGESAPSASGSNRTFAPPSAPALTAQSGASSGSVRLTWTAPGSDLPVTSYRVYRGSSAGAETLLAVLAASNTSFLDAGRPEGSTWAYRLSATSDAGEGDLSASVLGRASTLPTAPRDLTAAPTDGSPRRIELTWRAPLDAGGPPILAYRIYRGTQSGGETFLREVAPTTGTNDTVPLNSTDLVWYYRVSARTSVGISELSNEACSAAGPWPRGVTSPDMCGLVED